MRVLVVDDSIAYRKTISQILSECEGITVVGEVSNGKIAIQKMEQEPIDLITLDMEMPEMDGISTINEMNKKDIKTAVIVFASQNQRAASEALKALKLGAIDVIPKPNREYDSIRQAYEHVRELLLPKVIAYKNEMLNRSNHLKVQEAIRPLIQPKIVSDNNKKLDSQYIKVDLETFRPKIIVIGCSTGGPSALEKIFESIQGVIKVPILIVQHMPPFFTASLAERIKKISGIESREAKNGEQLQNQIYFAPGDYHMELLENQDKKDIRFKIHQGPKKHNVRPAVDFLFESTAKIFQKQTMGFVLTGMGQDGQEGAMAIKQAGGGMMIQSKESSTVWGMPSSVHEKGAFDKIGDLESCARYLKKMVKPITEA